jgi:hypothetical protein
MCMLWDNFRIRTCVVSIVIKSSTCLEKLLFCDTVNLERTTDGYGTADLKSSFFENL